MIDREYLENLEPYTRFKVSSSDGVARVQKTPGGTFFVFAPKSQKYGWHVNIEVFSDMYTLVGATEGEKWKKNVMKVVTTLSQSGLWLNILEMFRNISTMSYEDFLEITRRFRSLEYIPKESDESRQRRIAETFGEYLDKYPFIFDGGTNVNYDYLKGGLADARLKTMYFGRPYNKVIKEQIAYALANDRDYRGRGYTSYDVTFSYDSAKKKAYYSEEYKGCGNGHYYLALDANTALFCEDD